LNTTYINKPPHLGFVCGTVYLDTILVKILKWRKFYTHTWLGITVTVWSLREHNIKLRNIEWEFHYVFQWLSHSAGEHKPLADIQNGDVQVKHILLNAQHHFSPYKCLPLLGYIKYLFYYTCFKFFLCH